MKTGHKVAQKKHFENRLKQRFGVKLTSKERKTLENQIRAGQFEPAGGNTYIVKLKDKRLKVAFDETTGELVTVMELTPTQHRTENAKRYNLILNKRKVPEDDGEDIGEYERKSKKQDYRHTRANKRPPRSFEGSVRILVGKQRRFF